MIKYTCDLDNKTEKNAKFTNLDKENAVNEKHVCRCQTYFSRQITRYI